MRYRELILISLIVALWVVGTTGNLEVLQLWMSNASSLIVLSLAAGVIISIGQIDLSTAPLGSLLGMTVLFAWDYAHGTFCVFLTCLGLSCLAIQGVYVTMGVCVSRLGMSSFLLTLVVSFLAKGLSVSIQAIIQGALLPSLLGSGFAKSLVLPYDFVVEIPVSRWWLPMLITAWMVAWRHFSLSGLRHVAIGQNVRSARLAGVDVARAYLTAFAVAGILVCTSTVIYLLGTQQGGWSADTGWGRELIAISAAVIGGCRISGGEFAPIGSALGAVLIVAVQDLVDGSSLPTETSYLLFGTAMLLSVVIDRIGRRKNERYG